MFSTLVMQLNFFSAPHVSLLALNALEALGSKAMPVKDALKSAELAPDGSLYALRHTYVSHAIEGGVFESLITEDARKLFDAVTT
jgi:hypothetical protein